MSKENNIEEVVGNSFEEMPLEDMENTQGAGDVDAETTPAIPYAASVIVSAVSGAIVSAKKC